jgi:hypothetical protein
MNLVKYLPFTFLFLFCVSSTQAQEVKNEKEKSEMKDTLDGKLDLSNYIIKAHGLIPIPFIITQPALGSFGLGVAPLLISPKKRPEGYKGYIPPDITAGFGMYTANNTWGVGAGRMGSFLKTGIKYRVFFGYFDINMDYYSDKPALADKEFEFNISATPIFLQVSKKILKNEIYLGVQYFYTKNVLSANFKEDLPEFVTSKSLDSRIASAGIFLERDTRNTIFTPDKGLRVNMAANFNANWTGSDYDYQKIHGFAQWFIPIKKNWISGLNFDYQQALAKKYLIPVP